MHPVDRYNNLYDIGLEWSSFLALFTVSQLFFVPTVVIRQHWVQFKAYRTRPACFSGSVLRLVCVLSWHVGTGKFDDCVIKIILILCRDAECSRMQSLLCHADCNFCSMARYVTWIHCSRNITDTCISAPSGKKQFYLIFVTCKRIKSKDKFGTPQEKIASTHLTLNTVFRV